MAIWHQYSLIQTSQVLGKTPEDVREPLTKYRPPGRDHLDTFGHTKMDVFEKERSRHFGRKNQRIDSLSPDCEYLAIRRPECTQRSSSQNTPAIARCADFILAARISVRSGEACLPAASPEAVSTIASTCVSRFPVAGKRDIVFAPSRTASSATPASDYTGNTPTDYEGIISRDCSFLQTAILTKDPAHALFEEAGEHQP